MVERVSGGQQSPSAEAEVHEYFRTAALYKDLQLKVLQAVDELDRTVTIRRQFPEQPGAKSIPWNETSLAEGQSPESRTRTVPQPRDWFIRRGLASKRNSLPITPACLRNGRRAADPNIGSALGLLESVCA